MRKIIAASLDDADIPFVPDFPLDFYLPVQDVHIHVLTAAQEPHQAALGDNVVLVSGRAAVNALAAWIRG